MDSEFEAKLESLLEVFRPTLEKAHKALINNYMIAEATGFSYACLGRDLAVSFGFWSLRCREDGFIAECPATDIGFYDFFTIIAEIKRVLTIHLARNNLSSFVEHTEVGLKKVFFYLAEIFRHGPKDPYGRPFYLALSNTLYYVDVDNNEIIEHAEILRRLGFDPSKAESSGPNMLTPVPSYEELQPLNSLAEASAAFEKNPGYPALRRKYAESLLASGQDSNHLAIRLLLSAWSSHDDKAGEILRNLFFKKAAQFEKLVLYRVYLSHLIDLK